MTATSARIDTAPQEAAQPDVPQRRHAAPDSGSMGAGRVLIACLALLVPAVVAVGLARYGAPETAAWVAALGMAIGGAVACFLGRR